MNKTVNINLGGMFFHIDEDAYLKLTRYFDAIKRSLSHSAGQDEVIKDIEMRVSELLTEKQKEDKRVVGLKDVDAVIAVMGQPEDYIIEDETTSQHAFGNHAHRSSKKLYRDKDKGMLGGVAAGLGHYLGIETVWIRLILVLLVWGAGTGVVAYIILWVIVPEAVTTSEKLEMTGEPVTILNIEKKVREDFETVSERLKNVDYDKYGNQIKTSVSKIGDNLSTVLLAVFKGFAKFLGVLLVISGIAMLLLLLIGCFTLGSSGFLSLPWSGFIEAGNFTDYPVWSFGLLMFFAVGIPFFFLTILGFKLLSPTTKSIGNIPKYTLLALWIIALALAVSIGIKQAAAFAIDGRLVHKEELVMLPTDTLRIKFQHNAYYAKDVATQKSFKITLDSANRKVIYSNQVRFRIEETQEKTPYIQIEKEAKGSSLIEAKERAKEIQYRYQIQKNQLLLDNYLVTDLKNKFRDQEIEITLFLPVGVVFQLDASTYNYADFDGAFMDGNSDLDTAIYKVFRSGAKCVNCPEESNPEDFEEFSEDQEDLRANDQNHHAIRINKNGILITKDPLRASQNNVQELQINENGIRIKTK
ncbi:PspC domain-containing protein [Flavobacterium crassostreae]|uniref:Uncharacterized protein n=1 Tax=Flavobacterium crassostreae TaxID=1763534 RepID=A0A1B9E3F8_9FLAO|nr:PspC domain-containing protein [Flavobacterium crassostreae]OCB76471.1 hypothetical protein LPBF_05905 [Flavobacterium crassostreae]